MHQDPAPLCTILLVDVLHERTRSIKRYFARYGCYVHTTASPAQMRHACSVLIFDAVIVAVDHMMIALQDLNACLLLHHDPIVAAVSTMDTATIRSRADAIGASVFVQQEAHLDMIVHELRSRQEVQ
jgi:DNA-binding response OmpR family regulator